MNMISSAVSGALLGPIMVHWKHHAGDVRGIVGKAVRQNPSATPHENRIFHRCCYPSSDWLRGRAWPHLTAPNLSDARTISPEQMSKRPRNHAP